MSENFKWDQRLKFLQASEFNYPEVQRKHDERLLHVKGKNPKGRGKMENGNLMVAGIHVVLLSGE